MLCLEVKKSLTPLVSFLSKNSFIIFVPQINYVSPMKCYENTYQQKKFQKFNIEILITITYSNLKNNQKMSQRILEVNIAENLNSTARDHE